MDGMVYPEVVNQWDYQDVELRVRRLIFDNSRAKADERNSNGTAEDHYSVSAYASVLLNLPGAKKHPDMPEQS